MLYNDRVFAYEIMVRLNPVLDSANDEQMHQYTDADFRNHIAHLELKHFEQHKTFLFKHPLLLQFKLENELRTLKTVNPRKFIQEITNTSKNITRYQSQITNNRFKNEEEKQNWLDIIKECNMKISVIQTIITS